MIEGTGDKVKWKVVARGRGPSRVTSRGRSARIPPMRWILYNALFAVAYLAMMPKFLLRMISSYL